MLQISDVDLCLSPAGAEGKKNLSSDTYVKDADGDIANMDDLATGIPMIIETLATDDGKMVSSIGSSNLAVSKYLIHSNNSVFLLRATEQS